MRHISFGNWDFEILANEFDLIQLQDWGFEEINFCKTDINELDNNEIEFEDIKKFTLILSFKTEEEFTNVKKKLFEYGKSPSEGLINILNKLNI